MTSIPVNLHGLWCTSGNSGRQSTCLTLNGMWCTSGNSGRQPTCLTLNGMWCTSGNSGRQPTCLTLNGMWCTSGNPGRQPTCLTLNGMWCTSGNSRKCTGRDRLGRDVYFQTDQRADVECDPHRSRQAACGSMPSEPPNTGQQQPRGLPGSWRGLLPDESAVRHSV